MNYELYERDVDGQIRWWAIRRADENASMGVFTRWGEASPMDRLPHSNESTRNYDDFIREKVRKGYNFLATVIVDEASGGFEPLHRFSNPAAIAEEITWEFQPPYFVKEDKLVPDLMVWAKDLSQQLIGITTYADVSLKDPDDDTLSGMGGMMLFESWSLSFGAGCDFSSFNRCSGTIKREDGYFPVLFLMALRRRIEDESWRNGLFIAMPDATGVGDDLKKELSMLEFFGVKDLNEIRDAAVVFGLLQERIDLSLAAGNSPDWF